MAQQSSPLGLRALVCVFLSGGNDGHGTVIATDPASFSAFTTARSGAPGLAYNQSDLLPITPLTPQSGRTFALNPYLTGVQNLFNAGRAAIIANTGTLIAPTTKAQIQANSVPLPASLYSHFDQTAAWQAIDANGGSAVHTGWGGAMADLIASMNTNSAFTCISTAGIALFLSGQTSYQLNVTSAGPIPISGLTQPLFGQQAGSNALGLDPDRQRSQPLCQGVRGRHQPLHRRAGDARDLDAACRSRRRRRTRRSISTPSPTS